MALRLRYNDRSVVLPTGQLFVGRGAQCHIVTDDPQASRRHAVITMSKAGAFVSDLASKAGVLVNGDPVQGARRLVGGDLIQVTSLRILIEEVSVETEDEPTDPRLRSTVSPPAAGPTPASFRMRPTPPLGLPRVEIRANETMDGDDDDDAHPTEDLMRTLDAPRMSPFAQPKAPDFNQARSEGGVRAPLPPPIPRGEAPDPARISRLPPLPSFPRIGTLLALASVAEKAMALGRADEAERILHKPLIEAIEAASRKELDASGAELAASLSAKLATATGQGRWFDHAVAVYAQRDEVAPAAVIDLLFAAVHKAKGIDKAAFRDYLLAVTRPNSSPEGGDSPARRFVLQRLTGLSQIVDLK